VPALQAWSPEFKHQKKQKKWWWGTEEMKVLEKDVGNFIKGARSLTWCKEAIYPWTPTRGLIFK
jgi:hypothetical protein